MGNTKENGKPSLLNRWLNGIERVGNKLPHPISIFAILVLGVIFCLRFVRCWGYLPQVSW